MRRRRRSLGSVRVALKMKICGGCLGGLNCDSDASASASSAIMGTLFSSAAVPSPAESPCIWLRIPDSSANCPCCIIRSASSITRKERLPMSQRCCSPVLRRSQRRPGVATMTAGRFCSSLDCFWAEIPPRIGTTPTLHTDPTAFRCLHTCMASSRVGASTRARSGPGFGHRFSDTATAPPASLSPWSSLTRMCMIGRPNARVLPLPVCAAPMTSFQSRIAAGTHSAWTGVG
mmetsp:Transcript_33231/g.78813  ORF Transcript_33231/g.78813 Transcript_33231/m.78813 type:complete len:232 (-) Transcript_33231:692-1387(-)